MIERKILAHKIKIGEHECVIYYLQEATKKARIPKCLVFQVECLINGEQWHIRQMVTDEFFVHIGFNPWSIIAKIAHEKMMTGYRIKHNQQ